MSTAVVWFRNSLRIHDNPFLSWACNSEEVDSIVPIFLLDGYLTSVRDGEIGFNRFRFLVDCLKVLRDNLEKKMNLELKIYAGEAMRNIESIFQNLNGENNFLAYEYCNKPRGLMLSSQITEWSMKTPKNCIVKSFPAVHTLLDIEKTISSPTYFDPKSMKNMERIFMNNFDVDSFGYYNINEPIPVPNKTKTNANVSISVNDISISELELELGTLFPDRLNERHYFRGGEDEALDRLSRKIAKQEDFVNRFSKPRTCSTNLDDNPSEPSTTGLSPYITTGCISVRMLWKECEKAYLNGEHTKPPESLHGQLMFREMFYLLSRSVDNWDKSTNNINCKNINWDEYDSEKMDSWESGMTGFPYIDAMMRQLDETGWMHHLGRHAVSCFLTRGQMWQNWTAGRDVFEKKLLDADWAVNNGNWLWLAGVAPFSMPYYRIYNPCPDSKSSLNVETKHANFIRRWVPELRFFPSKYIFEPHLAPLSIQISSKCIIGDDYPLPILDRKKTRKENLARFKASIT